MTCIRLSNGELYYECDALNCHSVLTRNDNEGSIQDKGWFAKLDSNKWIHYCALHTPVVTTSHIIDVPIQSEVFQAMYRMDPMVLLELGRVMMVGEQSHNDTDTQVGQENWRRISFKDHFNHAFIHLLKDHQEQIYGEEVGDDEAGEHLAHAMCRLMFAMAVRNMEGAHVEKD